MNEPVKIIIEAPTGYGKTEIVDAIKNALKTQRIGLLCVKEMQEQPNTQAITLLFRY